MNASDGFYKSVALDGAYRISDFCHFFVCFSPQYQNACLDFRNWGIRGHPVVVS
jgi:hypothetical protein